MKAAGHKLAAEAGYLLPADGTTQSLGELEQLASALLAVVGDARLIAHPGGHLAYDEPHPQHHGKGEQILHVADGKGEVGIDKEEVKQPHIDDGRERSWPAAIAQGNQHHPQQEDHHQVGRIQIGHQVMGKECQYAAQQHSGQRAGNLLAPALGKAAQIRRQMLLGTKPAASLPLHGHHDQIQIRSQLPQPVDKTASPPPEYPLLTTTYHYLAQVMLPGVVKNGLRLILGGQRHRLGPQLASQLEGLQYAAPLGLRQPVQTRGLHIDSVPGATQTRRQPGRRAHHLVTAIQRPQTDQQGIMGMPDPLYLLPMAIGTHLIVHPLGGATQCQLAQGHEIALAKEVFDGPLRLSRQIDLPLLETLAQIVRRQVHQLDLVCLVEEAIRHRLPHQNAGDTAHYVVEALQMLDVDGGKHIDARLQQLLHILPALGMAGALDIAVGQLVHQHHGRRPGQYPVQIKLRQAAPAVEVMIQRLHRQPLQQSRRLAATVGFNDPHQHIQSLGAQPLGLLQHGVGLADPGVGTKEDLQPAALAGCCQQGIGIGAALFVSAHGLSAVCTAASLSSSRFRRNTLTTGRPSRPSGAGSITPSIRARNCPSVSWRALATLGIWK